MKRRPWPPFCFCLFADIQSQLNALMSRRKKSNTRNVYEKSFPSRFAQPARARAMDTGHASCTPVDTICFARSGSIYDEEMHTCHHEAINEGAIRDGRAIAVTTKANRSAVKGVNITQVKTGAAKARSAAAAIGIRRRTGGPHEGAGAKTRIRDRTRERAARRNQVITAAASPAPRTAATVPANGVGGRAAATAAEVMAVAVAMAARAVPHKNTARSTVRPPMGPSRIGANPPARAAAGGKRAHRANRITALKAMVRAPHRRAAGATARKAVRTMARKAATDRKGANAMVPNTVAKATAGRVDKAMARKAARVPARNMAARAARNMAVRAARNMAVRAVRNMADKATAHNAAKAMGRKAAKVMALKASTAADRDSGSTAATGNAE